MTVIFSPSRYAFSRFILKPQPPEGVTGLLPSTEEAESRVFFLPTTNLGHKILWLAAAFCKEAKKQKDYFDFQ